MTWRRWRDWWVPAVGALVLATSVMPWYGTQRAAGSGSGRHMEQRYMSAWEASSLWSAAMVLSAAATVAWLLWRLVRGGVPIAGRLVLALLPLTSIILIAKQWRQRRPFDAVYNHPRSTISMHVSPSDPVPWPTTVRDHLLILHQPGMSMDVRWGAYAGLAAVSLLILALLSAKSGTPLGREGGPGDTPA